MGLEFTDSMARRLEPLYLTADVVAQRSETLNNLRLAEGESVIDNGCGPGFLCESMAEIVGRTGRVVGLDISHDLVRMAEGRNKRKSISYRQGDAIAIAEPDASFDVAVCTQVAEYIPAVDKAISEAFRVLKSGGRAVFIATDWDAVIWHSDIPARMAAVMKSREAHCAHPQLPRSMSERPARARRRARLASASKPMSSRLRCRHACARVRHRHHQPARQPLAEGLAKPAAGEQHALYLDHRFSGAQWQSQADPRIGRTWPGRAWLSSRRIRKPRAVRAGIISRLTPMRCAPTATTKARPWLPLDKPLTSSSAFSLQPTSQTPTEYECSPPGRVTSALLLL